MNTTAKIGLGIALVAVAAAGCSNKDSQLVGKWKVAMPKSTPSDPKNPMAGVGDAFAGMMSNMMSLELKADHSFVMTVIVSIEGNWALSGDTVTLTPTKMMGKTLDELKKSSNGSFKFNSNSDDKPITLTLSSDGKTLSGKDPKTGKDAMTFQKAN